MIRKTTEIVASGDADTQWRRIRKSAELRAEHSAERVFSSVLNAIVNGNWSAKVSSESLILALLPIYKQFDISSRCSGVFGGANGRWPNTRCSGDCNCFPVAADVRWICNPTKNEYMTVLLLSLANAADCKSAEPRAKHPAERGYPLRRMFGGFAIHRRMSI